MKTYLINLFAGPGAGKSTLAAGIFYFLKKQGKSAELVQEVAKEWAWSGRTIDAMGQMRILSDQIEKERPLYNKVEYIITDSPLELALVYTLFNGYPLELGGMLHGARSLAKDVVQINCRVPRLKKYNPNGRFQTEDEALKLDEEIDFLIPFHLELKTDDALVSVAEILAHIKEEGL
jgi:hypothetical protein